MRLRFQQLAFQATNRIDGTRTPLLVKTFDEIEIRLSESNKRADVDLSRRPTQMQTASSPLDAFDDTVPDEQLHDLDQQMVGNAVSARHLLDRHEVIRVCGQIDQEPKRVVRKLCQPHRVIRRRN
jgi:hypothetical protein